MAESEREPQQQQENGEIQSEYANNTLIDPTIWDIKVLFGEYSARLNSVDWHTSVTMPWAAAKLLVLYLQSNIAIYEMNSKIVVPSGMIPPPPTKPSQATPQSEQLYQQLKDLHDRFLASM